MAKATCPNDLGKRQIPASSRKEIKMKYGNLTLGQIEAGVNKIGGEEAFVRLLRGELTVSDVVTFDRNEHGHVVITFIGTDITGAQEIELLRSEGYRVGDYAKQCLTSTKPDSYDAKHRLVAGQTYKVALVPGKEILKDFERTTENLRKLGMEKYGYGKPLAGFIPRIRQKVSDKQMEEMGIWYIASPHDPIKDSDGLPDVLIAIRSGGGRWVRAYYGDPGYQWGDGGAFAFPVSAS